MFIKQNIGGKPMTADELKLQISAGQSERDRLTMLFSEYVGDTVHVSKEKHLKSYKDALQKLIRGLTTAFMSSDPSSHELFTDSIELKPEAYKRLFDCYEI